MKNRIANLCVIVLLQAFLAAHSSFFCDVFFVENEELDGKIVLEGVCQDDFETLLKASSLFFSLSGSQSILHHL